MFIKNDIVISEVDPRSIAIYVYVEIIKPTININKYFLSVSIDARIVIVLRFNSI